MSLCGEFSGACPFIPLGAGASGALSWCARDGGVILCVSDGADGIVICGNKSSL